MSEDERSGAPMGRHRGRVKRVGTDFGFIASNDLAQDVYFRPSWYRGAQPLREQDEVVFEVRAYGDRLNALNIARPSDPGGDDTGDVEAATLAPPVIADLLGWAYMGHLPSTLEQLARLALRERWEFKNTAPDPARPLATTLAARALALDWAYQNARLICRPDSDWLSAENIDEAGEEDTYVQE